MSLAPIPFTAIAEFARVYNIEEVEDFLYYIRRLDTLYIKHEEGKK